MQKKLVARKRGRLRESCLGGSADSQLSPKHHLDSKKVSARSTKRKELHSTFHRTLDTLNVLGAEKVGTLKNLMTSLLKKNEYKIAFNDKLDVLGGVVGSNGMIDYQYFISDQFSKDFSGISFHESLIRIMLDDSQYDVNGRTTRKFFVFRWENGTILFVPVSNILTAESMEPICEK